MQKIYFFNECFLSGFGYYIYMGRIVGFVGARPGVGVTTICFELAKKLANRRARVCVFDFYFSINDISQKFEVECQFDLSDYLIGKIGFDGVTQRVNEDLYLIKSNKSRFDYLRYKADIKNLISSLSFQFDYILIDINSFDFRNLEFAAEIITEAYLIFDNEPNSIIMIARIKRILNAKCNIQNINLVLNKSCIIGQLKRKYLSRNEIEELLCDDIIFEFPKFFKYNNFYNKKGSMEKFSLIEKFCSCFESNKVLRMQYAKKYKGFLGRLKREYYAKFE